MNKSNYFPYAFAILFPTLIASLSVWVTWQITTIPR